MAYNRIHIGYDYGMRKYQQIDKPIYFYTYDYGTVLVVAKAGYGKSSTVKEIIVQEYYSSNRPIIIFDRDKEWVNSITKSSNVSDEPKCILKYNYITNYSIKISDVREKDWFFLFDDLADGVDVWLTRLGTQGKEYHKDNPDKFYDMCVELPVLADQLETWNKKYPNLLLKEKVFVSTKTSLVTKIRDIRHRFYNPDKDDLQYIDDWYNEIKMSPVTIIDLQVPDYKPDRFVTYVIGHILEKLGERLVYLKPIIVVEESDYLCGSPATALEKRSNPHKSTGIFLTYVTKYRKKGVFMFFITQTFKRLHYELRRNQTAELFGQLEESDDPTKFNEWHNRIEKQHGFNLVDNKRPMFYKDKIRGRNVIFYPKEPCCNIKTQGEVWN